MTEELPLREAELVRLAEALGVDPARVGVRLRTGEVAVRLRPEQARAITERLHPEEDR